MILDVPGRGRSELSQLLLDLNGTLSARGELLPGVGDRLAGLRPTLSVHLLSADTFGTLGRVAEKLGVRAETVATGAEKAAYADRLGAERCVAVGNGANDVPMLERVALAIVVIGPEGAAGAAVRAADVVCASILDALDLLADERALVATLRR